LHRSGDYQVRLLFHDPVSAEILLCFHRGSRLMDGVLCKRLGLTGIWMGNRMWASVQGECGAIPSPSLTMLAVPEFGDISLLN
jgi:hypothetical protein